MTSLSKDSKVVKKTRPVFKHILETPFQINLWPETNDKDQDSVFEILKLFFETEGDKLVPKQDATTNDTKVQVPVIIGFNNVTKALEFSCKKRTVPVTEKYHLDDESKETRKDNSEIAMVIVCRQDIGSELAVAHFPTLCGGANVSRLIEIPKGSANDLTKIYNQVNTLQTPEPTANNKTACKSKSHSKSRNVEITVLAFTHASLLQFPLLQNLYTMLEDRNSGFVRPQTRVFKKANIATVKTVAPIVNKKQDAKKQKIAEGSKDKNGSQGLAKDNTKASKHQNKNVKVNK